MNFPLEVILTTKDEGRLGERNKERRKKISASNGWTNFLICKTTAVGCHLLLVYSRDQNPRVKNHKSPGNMVGRTEASSRSFCQVFPYK